jgi:hypothetical protein
MARRLPARQPQSDPPSALAGSVWREEKSSERTLVRIVRCSKGLLDEDNLWGSIKPVLDQLRYSGLIPGDRPDQIELKVEQIKVKKENVGTWIQIVT